METLGLGFLLLELLDLARDAAPLGKVEGRILGCAFLRGLGAFVVARELERARDLLNEARKVFGRLRCDGLDVALKHEKVFGLDKDVLVLERLVVGLVGDNPVVQTVFAGAIQRNASTIIRTCCKS